MSDTTARRRGASRRQFLMGGAVAGVGAAAAIGLDAWRSAAEAMPDADSAAASSAEAVAAHGADTVPFFGTHQAGVTTDAQAHAVVLGLDLLPNVNREGLRRLMRVLSDDASRLTQGRPALADSEPELAANPARLTVTFGFGREFVDRAEGAAPSWLRPLPPFTIDRLQPEFSDGDLMIQIASNDPVTTSHAARMLHKDSRSFTSLRWWQQGFREAYGSVAPGTTMRNLFGQVDGTANMKPGSAEFERLVWVNDGWLVGGTSMVVRRIRMQLDTWDRLDRDGREQSVGRRLANGAPLTGTNEHDEPDFAAVTAIGFPVIPEFSHIRRARAENPDEQIFRRAYNYDGPPDSGGESGAGLLFISFQRDVDEQFVPMQQRLDELDLLNEWTTPIGSAVFAIPPGCAEGGYIGETLLG